MPHVIVKLYPGRTDAQKERLAEAIAQSTAEIAGCALTSVSVAFQEVAPDAWAEAVYRPEIIDAAESLVRAPGYNPFES